MRYLLIVSITFLFWFNSFSQKTIPDTMDCVKLVKGNWGIKAETGALLHQMPDQDCIDNNIVQTADYSIFFKKYYLTFGGFMLDFRPRKQMRFDSIMVNRSAELYSTNFNLGFGYNFDFHKNWSADVKLGINSSSFEIANPEEINQFYESEILYGAIIGVGIDRYFKLKRNNYLFINIGMDYYTTDYSIVSPDLSKSSMNYSLTIGYKGWFRKIIE